MHRVAELLAMAEPQICSLLGAILQLGMVCNLDAARLLGWAGPAGVARASHLLRTLEAAGSLVAVHAHRGPRGTQRYYRLPMIRGAA